MTISDIAQGAFRPPNMRDKRQSGPSWDDIASLCGDVGPHQGQCLSCNQVATYWLEESHARWSCEHCGEAGTAQRRGLSQRKVATAHNRKVLPDGVARFYRKDFALPDELKALTVKAEDDD